MLLLILVTCKRGANESICLRLPSPTWLTLIQAISVVRLVLRNWAKCAIELKLST